MITQHTTTPNTHIAVPAYPKQQKPSRQQHWMVHGSARPAPGYVGGPQASSLHARRPRVPTLPPGASNGATPTPSTWTSRHHHHAHACLDDLQGSLQRGRMAYGSLDVDAPRRPGLGRRGFFSTLWRATTFFEAFSYAAIYGLRIPRRRRRGAVAPRHSVLSGMPHLGQMASGPREATPRSRDGQSHRRGR